MRGKLLTVFFERSHALHESVERDNNDPFNPYVPEVFFGKGKFHVLEAPEKSKNDMEVLRPVLSTSRRGAFNAVEKNN